jgi:prepilin-type N-terminal cleavage/methylation domain-containing protein
MSEVAAKGEGRLLERPRAGFTLIELLIVIAIMAVLAGLLVSGIRAAQKRAFVAKAKSNIDSIRTALAAYNTLTGVYPHGIGGTPQDNPEALFRALYSGNPMSGGTAQNHLEDWHREAIGLWRGPVMDPTHVWDNPTDDQLLTISKSYVACVFLDPWGRPFHYVEWDSLPPEARRLNTLRAPGAAPYSIWSDGPDRVNDVGQNDDVTSWSD